MANTIVAAILPAGWTSHVIKLYQADTLLNAGGDALTAGTNNTTLYTATVADAVIGDVYAEIENSAGTRMAGFVIYDMADDTGTYPCEEQKSIAAAQSGLATPTNITAGTITTVTNLTNAPTAGDLTATMKTSVTTAATAATPIAASVSGNVVGSVGSVLGEINAAAGTIKTLDALDTAQDTQHTTTQGTLATIAGYLDTEIAAILADTNELQTDWVNGGRLDLLIDSIITLATFIKDVEEGDHTVDTTNPLQWQLVIKRKGTATELIRKNIKDIDGTPLVATTTVRAQFVEP